MSSAPLQDGPKESQGNSIYAALARTMTRSAALYFSRPVRLFRPSKVSGWHSLKGLAVQEGTSLTPQFLSQLVKAQGFMVIPKHFFPPLVVNALLGTVLWTTFSVTSSALEPRMSNYPIGVAAISGATAGGAQAVVAAPAENVRLAIEGGSVKGGWSHAWKEVFRGTSQSMSHIKQDQLQEIRQVRNWMKDVREMAGRGWDGWGWGLAKDVCGFAVFFSIFEITRRVAIKTKSYIGQYYYYRADEGQPVRRHLPRLLHGVTLVSGGVIAGLAYELSGRPWDVARRTLYLSRVHSTATHTSKRLMITLLLKKVNDDGLLGFFRDPNANDQVRVAHGSYRQTTYAALRTLGRVGPWGVGFLVWEAFGPGIP